MIDNSKVSNIPCRLHNVGEGGVAGADEVIDDKKGKSQQQINAEVDQILGAGGSVDERIAAAVAPKANSADVYTKTETYNKTELNNLITTPEQGFVTVTATDETTDVTDILPATGEADTTYRVGNWDGNQYNDSVFSEYAWNGSAYIKLSTKSQIGEVYDISANHADTKYADLAAALGTNGANIPQSLRKGGMSVKYVQSSDNKYVQYRLMSDTFNTTVGNWQDENTAIPIVTDKSKSSTVPVGNSGNVSVKFSALAEELERDTYYNLFRGDSTLVVLFNKGYSYDPNHYLYCRVGETYIRTDIALETCLFYDISLTWGNGSITLAVNGKEYTGEYTETVTATSIFFGYRNDTTVCVSGWIQSATVNGVSVLDSISNMTTMPIKEYVNLLDKLTTKIKELVDKNTSDIETNTMLTVSTAASKSDTVQVGDSGSMSAKFSALVDDLEFDKYYCIFHDDDNTLFLIFNKGHASNPYHNIYCKVNDCYIITDFALENCLFYNVSLSWDNGSVTLVVNGKEYTGEYTGTVSTSLCFGKYSATSPCVSGWIQSAFIDETSVIGSISNTVAMSIKDYYYNLLDKFATITKGITDENTADIADNAKEIGRRLIKNDFAFTPFYYHFSANGFLKDKNGNNVIPSESLADIRIAARLGFKFIEANIQELSDGNFVCIHGNSGVFGRSVISLDGQDTMQIRFSDVDLAYVRQYIRYDSSVDKYKTTVPTLEEFLKVCKENNIGIFAGTSNINAQNLCRQYLTDDQIIFYNPGNIIRNTFSGMVFRWYNNTATVAGIINDANIYGAPFMAGIGPNLWENLSDSDKELLISEMHSRSYIVGLGYIHGVALQNFFKIGGDFCAADYEVNPFEGNYLLFDLNAPSLEMTTTGSLSNGVLTLNAGQTMECGSEDILSLGKVSISMNFVGTLNITYGSVGERTSIVSDGTYNYTESDYLLQNDSILHIEAVENTVIKELVYKVSQN